MYTEKDVNTFFMSRECDVCKSFLDKTLKDNDKVVIVEEHTDLVLKHNIAAVPCVLLTNGSKRFGSETLEDILENKAPDYEYDGIEDIELPL